MSAANYHVICRSKWGNSVINLISVRKSDLRKIYLAARKNLSAEEKQVKSRLVADGFFDSFDLRETEFLHCFLPIKKFGEINTRLIFKRIWREFPHIRTLAPRIDFQDDLKMQSLKINAETETAANIWEINEPAESEIIAPEKIDVILIPLLCFDRRGQRVGYGKGFYDKFLKTCRAECLKIGLSYFPPVAEIADADEFDVKLDFCVTPEQTLILK